MSTTPRQKAYWRKNLQVIAGLLVIWFIVTFVVSFYARELRFNFFGWPFSFWMGAQGSMLVYGGIIWFYARYMDKLDAQYEASEDDD